MLLEHALPLVVLGSVVLSAVFSILIRWVANRTAIVDEPTGGRKIHEKRTALLGGVATGLTIITGLAFLTYFVRGDDLNHVQVIGFIIAIMVLLIGGILDDAFDLPPWLQILSPIIASIVIVLSGSGIIQVTDPLNPGAISLVWNQWEVLGLTLSWPSDLLTIIWLLVVTYAMKFLDGIDGLVTGLTIIGALLIASLAGSDAYFQPVIAMMALIVAGAHLGFLPFNKTGSIFLGESGSVIAGFSLGVLAIISGAKVAIASAALAVPLVDIVIVVIGRLVRGQSPFKGDRTHLHHRLLQAGLSRRGAVRLIW
ncbi:hypothetical protein GF380_04110, partial [Candidatus Uhrbacteria bacterium]|nr:hypothetical protein [Candidatus Uhrbacteria bacterium]MBD3284268.1 hypothetical protein [Candidatus Uhrbacteria bacterium]